MQKKKKKKKKTTQSRLAMVYRDDAEGHWASRCLRRENTSHLQATNVNRFESHTQHLGRKWSPQARSVRVQSLTLSTLSCQGITKTTMQSGSAASHQKKICEAPNGPEQSAFEPTTTRFKISGLQPRLFRNRRIYAKQNHVGDRHGVLHSRSGKEGLVRFNKLE